MFSIPVGIVYRPNSAKVKNLKTKDYLGKARLIASSDTNTSTGFAGPEIKRNKATAFDFSRDDRPLENISFAASNLVKPDIRSRTRQQSEPPINRNMFPPTPPPDYDHPTRPTLMSMQTSPPIHFGQTTGRANSVRSPPNRPERLDLSKQSLASKPALNKELPRVGTTRTASEPGGPRRNYSSSHSDRSPPRRRSRGRLFMETTPLRRRDDGDDGDVDEYPDELYDMYSLHRRSKDSAHHPPPPPSHRTGSRTRLRSRSRPRPGSIDEVDEDGPPHSADSLDAQFDLLTRPSSHSRRPRPHNHHHHHHAPAPRPRSRSRRPATATRHIRVKVHGGDDDTRYVMIAAGMGWEEFVGRVREKFGMGGAVKIKVRDEEGDFITLGDRDDWEMAVGMVVGKGRRGGGGENGGSGWEGREEEREVEREVEVGKMEVSFSWLELGFPFSFGGKGAFRTGC